MSYASSPISDVFYPDCDGNPMSDNTEQFRWIVIFKENLEILFATFTDVFIAGDLLWYPIEGDNKTRLAPDVMVVFGRPKGRRGSYQQWKEDNVAPQVAFEIMSPNNTQKEMATKRLFYETYGVEEFYIYDPDRLRLTGWVRQGGQLMAIANMEGWVSPLLGIRFSQVNRELEVYRPDGRRFLSSVELEERAQEAIAREERAIVREEQAVAREEEAIAREEKAIAREEEALQIAEAERAKAEKLVAYLRSIGVDPEQI
jgi:Uma2 family endonuclease